MSGESLHWRRGFAGALRRAAVSGLSSVALVGLSVSGLFVTEAPRWVSLTIEPLSLLLIPGVFFSLLLTARHDYTDREILKGTFVFYLIVIYVLLWGWDRAVDRRRGMRG